MSLRSKVCEIIHARPGVTPLEISTVIYRSFADQDQVARICRELLREGLVSRTGKGGPRDPYRYSWLRKSPVHASEALHLRQCGMVGKVTVRKLGT